MQLACALVSLLTVLSTASPSLAQDRVRSTRPRFELSFDHGFGGGTEGAYVELAPDLRLHFPGGLGIALRTGVASNGWSNALAADLGFAARFDVAHGPNVGLQLGGTIGPSVAYGPFDQGPLAAFGGWAMAHADFWHRRAFLGLALVAHAMWAERYASGGRSDPILTLTPTVRIGGEWGL